MNFCLKIVVCFLIFYQRNRINSEHKVLAHHFSCVALLLDQLQLFLLLNNPVYFNIILKDS